MSTRTTAVTPSELNSAIVREPLIVSPSTMVIDAIAKMSGIRSICASTSKPDNPLEELHLEARSSCVLVVADGHLLGILTERDIVRLSAQHQSLDHLSVQEVMVSPVTSLRESAFTDIFSTANFIQQKRIRHLPLLNDQGQIVGLLTHESLRQLSRPADLLRLRLVSEVMTTEVVCADPQVSMLEIAQLMASHRVGSILLVREEGEAEQRLRIPLGIITERDIVQFQSLYLNLATVAVGAVMSTPVFSVNPGESLWVVQQVMAQQLIRRLVVTGSQGELVGIVTQTSILKVLNPLELYALTEILEQKVSQLEAEKVRLLETYTAELEQKIEQRTAEIKAQVKREQLLTKIALGIRHSLQLEEILETTVMEVQQFLAADRVLVYQFQPDMSGMIVTESVLPGWPVALGSQIQDMCFQQYAGNNYDAGKIRAIADIYQADLSPCHRQLLEQFEVKAKLMAPILVRDQLWGLLIAHQCSGTREWQAVEVDLFDQLTAQIAIAIQQATAYQQAQVELAERQRAEVSLRQSEERFRAIFENTSQFIGLLSPDGTLLEANQAWLTAAEIQLEDVVGQPFWKAHWWQISPETQEQLQQAIARAAQGHLVRYEVNVLGIHQTIIPIDFSIRAIFDGADQVILLISEGRDLREVKRRELELRQSEQRFISLAATAPVGIFRTDDLGNCLYVNERWCQIAGLTIAEAAGFGWVNSIHPEDRELVATEWNASVQESRPFHLEYRFQNSAGQITWVFGQAVAEHNPDGQVIGYVGTITDISEAKRNEAERHKAAVALRESEERLRLALGAANQGLYDLNLQTGEAIVTPEYATMLGFDPVTFHETNAEWIERMHPDDRASVTRTFQTYLAGDLPEYKVEFRQRTQSGGWKWILSLGKIVAWDESGNPLRMLGTHTDISDLKQTEEESQHRLDILEAARDIIASANSTGKVIYLNQAGCDLLGLAPDEDILQTSISDYHPPEIAELIVQEALPQCTQQGFWAGETLFRRRDGSDFPTWQVIVAHRYQDGNISHFSTIARDITDLKQAEAERVQTEQLRLELTLLENILNIILAGYWDWDIPNNQEYLSPGFKHMFGYEDHELPNSPETWQSLIFAEDLPGVLECFNLHVQSRGEVPYHSEVRYHHKDGSTVWVICSGQVIEWDAAGNPLRMIGCHIDVTESKQAEEQLKKNDAHLRTAQRIGKLGSWEFDVKTQQIIWSEEVFRIFGRSPVLGTPSFEELQQQVHPDDRDQHQQMVQAAIETAQPYEIEYRLYQPDGTLRYIQARGEPIVDAMGKLIQLVGTVLDISDRKQAEQQLKDSEERWQLAILGSNAGIWDWDLKTNQVFRSARWKEMWGYEGDETTTVFGDFGEWENRIHPDDRNLVTAALERHFTHKTPLYQAEYRIQHQDGSILWVLDRGQALWDETDAVTRMLGSVTDISDLKQAEEQLQNLSDRLTLAIKSGAIAIWDWDVTQNILIWDDRMYELYGVTPDQFTSVYNAWANSLHPDDRPHAEAAIQQALTGEKDYDPEFRVIHPDGSIHFIKAYALVQRNEQGEPQHMIGINFDITDRKQAEIKLLQTTAQLATSNQELEAFAYSVSHDLRSPLRTIDGFSKALMEDYEAHLDEEAKDYLNCIRAGVHRMGALIDDLLRLSRVSRSEMQHKRVNLSDLVKQIAADLQKSEPERQVEFVIVPEAIVFADANLMQVVLQNLLQNAWKFTSHHETARIEFGTTQMQDQTTYFVRDNGAGFDMTFASMLFRVFQRLHNTDEFPGTGIGLATVQRVIHRHGGRIWAEGVVEKGAILYFTLPSPS